MTLLKSLLISVSFLLLASGECGAIVLDWANLPSGQSWTAGATSGSFNPDASNPGNDITVSAALGGSVTWTASSPQNTIHDSSVIGSDDAIRLHLRTPGFVNTTSTITVTITFSYALGVNNVSFTLLDVDAATGSTGWIDRFSSITATPVTGPANSVALSASNGGSTVTTITGNNTTGLVVAGNTAAGNITDHTGDVTFTSGATPITSITFTWNNPGPNFGGQVIAVSNISFTPVPEVASSSAAVLLCSGLLAFGRRRENAARLTV